MLRAPGSLDARTAAATALYRALLETLAQAHAAALDALARGTGPKRARECDAAIVEIEDQLRELRAAMQYDRDLRRR